MPPRPSGSILSRLSISPTPRPGLPTPLRSPRASPRNSPHVSPAASPKHSPVTSPRAPKHGDTQGCAHRCVHGYLCGRVSLLHVSVVCVLLGITLLVVGLVQLAPGAGSGINKYAIIGAGTGFLGLGFLFLILLCACQKNTHRRRRPPPHLIQAQPNHKGKTGSGRSNKGHPRSHTRQMQVHTVEGSVAVGGEGGCHGERGARGQQGTGVQLRTVNEKDMSLEGFVKSPSESDALIESTCRRQ
ncbi:uncharacterized protein LOC122253699 isoform X2 [Penaeus japonicus]|uniref:uncharacterized protein LOC122253699 isoform X2 n=1 Tax=Penaeus japonicus TaxID=27405 RepID=UPI001C71530D|nr:uncharacterized protein LOC122253699 isoform X2 [Penaeus japonicus]